MMIMAFRENAKQSELKAIAQMNKHTDMIMEHDEKMQKFMD